MRVLGLLNSSARVKRIVDLAGALAALAIFAPVMLATAAYIRIAMGGPVLFRQERTGKGGAIFTLFKFRTMREGQLPDALRLTPAGALLRSLSLDELPQLWNVLRGEMSLVGPRPLLPQYLPHYTAFQRRRFDVKPGITGWSQVHGRNTLKWEEKFRLDVSYVEKASLTLDLAILLKTVFTVLGRTGINQPGMATVSLFAPSTCEGRDSL